LPKDKLLFKIQESKQEFIANKDYLPGQIFEHNGNLAIMCQDLAILPVKVQLEGKKAMSSADFLKGNSWIIGKALE